MATKVISEAVMDVLRRSTFEGNKLILPDQLERKLYVAVADVIERGGGKWDKRAGCHTFPVDVSELFEGILGTGIAPAKNPLAFYETPGEVITRMIDACTLGGVERILEPSAGNGAIVARARSRWPGAEIEWVELDEERAAVAQLRFHADLSIIGHTGNFLNFPAFVQRSYDLILMNPPYAVEGSPSEYVKHFNRALTMLRPGGQLVGLAPEGLRYRNDQAIADLRARILSGGYIESLPEGSFHESGTDSHVVMAVYNRGAA